MNKDIFAPTPSFTSNGETLTIETVIRTKKITSVTIGYLSKERKVRQGGFQGLLGFKKTVQEEKEITITDPEGIALYFTDGTESATIRFWEKKEFEKLSDKNYDESTLWRRYVLTIVRPYQINFPIGNLKKMEWVNKQAEVV